MRKLLFIFALLLTPAARGQVFQLTGGSSTTYNAVGGGVTMWLPGSATQVGAGYADGHFVAGASTHFLFQGWDIFAGDHQQSITAGAGSVAAPIRGLTASKKTKHQAFLIFAGAAGDLFSAPYFTSMTTNHFGTGYQYTATFGGVELDSLGAIIGARKSELESATWKQKHFNLAGTTGLLQNQFLLNGTAGIFTKYISLNGARQDYIFQGEKSTVENIGAGFNAGALSANASQFRGVADGNRTSGWTTGAGYQLWDGAVGLRGMYFRSAFGASETFSVSERVTPRLRIVENVTQQKGNFTIDGGGTYVGNRFTATVDWQEYFMPDLVGRSPFERALTASVTFNVRNAGATLATLLTPNGRIKYTAYADTYVNGPLGGSVPGQQAPRTGRYTVALLVVDPHGDPVAGATVYVGKELCITDTLGTCLMRFHSTKPLPVLVVCSEFGTPGRWAASAENPVTTAPSSDPAYVKITVNRQ